MMLVIVLLGIFVLLCLMNMFPVATVEEGEEEENNAVPIEHAYSPINRQWLDVPEGVTSMREAAAMAHYKY